MKTIWEEKNLILIIICSILTCCILLFGCKPQSQMSNYTVKDSIVYKLDTVIMVNPADSALIMAIVECDSLNRAYLDTLIFKSKKIGVKGSVKKSVLKIAIRCNEDSLKKVIANFEKYSKTFANTVQIKEIKNPINKGLAVYCIVITLFSLLLLCVKLR